MKNAISRSLTDAHLADAEVIPTDSMEVPDKESIAPTETLVADALKNRAELSESRIDLITAILQTGRRRTPCGLPWMHSRSTELRPWAEDRFLVALRPLVRLCPPGMEARSRICSTARPR